MKRFNGAPVWAALSDGARDTLGKLIIEWAYAATVTAQCEGDGGDSAAERACVAAVDAVELQVLDILADSMPVGLIAPDDPEVAVPEAVGQVCRKCGCTEGDPCFPSCHWVEQDLCSNPICNV